MSDPTFISSLQPQYYFRESDGKLSKVVGDANWKTNVSPNNTQPPVKGAPPKTVKPNVSEKEIKEKVQKAKQKAIQEKNKTSEKSKSNKKTVKGL